MAAEVSRDALVLIFKELAELQVNPTRLKILRGKKLGSGGYGDVWLATLDGSLEVAVKELRIGPLELASVRIAKRLCRELKVWAQAKHRNVLELVGYHLSDDYGRAYFISPYMVNGNVKEYISRSSGDPKTRLNFVSAHPDTQLNNGGPSTLGPQL
ncbi:hypothetical protein FRB90_011304 [Tulasnella sp. 427]|nr:hypothetical protein FRB90_011304 [Tulasnella sp. 427]